jgi:hypothetical protein
MDSFVALCVLLRALRGSALFYRKVREGFAKGRKEEVLNHETEPVQEFRMMRSVPPWDSGLDPADGTYFRSFTKRSPGRVF